VIDRHLCWILAPTEAAGFNFLLLSNKKGISPLVFIFYFILFLPTLLLVRKMIANNLHVSNALLHVSDLFSEELHRYLFISISRTGCGRRILTHRLKIDELVVKTHKSIFYSRRHQARVCAGRGDHLSSLWWMPPPAVAAGSIFLALAALAASNKKGISPLALVFCLLSF